MQQVVELKMLLSILRDTLYALSDVRPGSLQGLAQLVERIGRHVRELDALVEYTLRDCEKTDKHGRPKICRIKWMLHSRTKLSRVLDRLKSGRLSLTAALSAVALVQGCVWILSQLRLG